jgi:putative FmdB family regulatory protein
MPTYEYKCGNCGHLFEKFSTKMTDESSVDCPRCDGLAERLISGGAVLLFKGSGFYTTDYRSDSYKKEAKKETKPDATKSSDEKKPEKKPEKKSEKKPEKKGNK